jgi:Mn2+/Fe2+ NRAMP family transporter
MNWEGSLDDRPKQAEKFYAVLAVAVLAGLALNFFHVSAVRMLFLAAVVNGLLAPPLIVLVVLLTSDPTVMGTRTNGPVLRWLGWIAAAVMGIAAIAMFLTL